MRLIMATAALVATATPTQAGPASLNLSLHVPLQCAVTRVEMVDVDQGHLRLSANCNAASFGVFFGGALRDRTIKSATAPNANVTIRNSSMVVTPDSPGTYTFDIRYETPITSLEPIQAEIRAL